MQPLTRSQYRISSIDLLRGIVMIIMALDHTRDLFHVKASTADPLDLSTTTPALFLTRWITHFCAPVFVFLAGTSAWLQGLRKPKRELSKFLISRGLWLILMEVTIVNFVITYDIFFQSIVLQTIWAIGISMVFLGLFVWLPFPVILAMGAVIMFGHNYLDRYEVDPNRSYNIFYHLLHLPTFMSIDRSHALGIFYPFLPWVGVMTLGYCFGRIVSTTDPSRRTRTFVLIGVAVTVFFVIVRYINDYGNPRPWSVQSTTLYTLFSFINTQKYPPSLLYAAMTIGPALIVLGLLNNAGGRLSRIVKVYGEVPFFYYILHFFVLHLVATIFFFIRGHSFAEGFNQPQNSPL